MFRNNTINRVTQMHSEPTAYVRLINSPPPPPEVNYSKIHYNEAPSAPFSRLSIGYFLISAGMMSFMCREFV